MFSVMIFFFFFFFFFRLKILVLLSLECIFLFLLFFLCVSFGFSPISIFCSILFSVFMVLDSVFGLSVLLSYGRSGSMLGSSLLVI